MIFMILPAWLLLMIPHLIAGAGKLIGSASAIRAQNRYNSPFQQVQRLKAAGLPFAAFSAGQAGNQSQLPDFSGFDNIGNAVNSGINQSNQIDMFRELLRKAGFDADIRENEAALSAEDFLEMGMSGRVINGEYITNQRFMKRMEIEMKEMDWWYKRYEGRIKEIDAKIKEDLAASGKLSEGAEAEIDRLLLSNKLLRQQLKSNDDRAAAQAKIVETMSKGGLSFWEALMLQVLGGLSGGISGGGMNLGF